MCDVCGCGQGEVRIEGIETRDGHRHDHQHRHPHSHPLDHHRHQHSHETGDDSGGAGGPALHYGHGAAGAHAPGLTQARMVQIELDVLAKNDAFASENRVLFGDRGILALNLVSSPGSGKTSLLTATIGSLKDTLPMAVIEGDQQTLNDAERIRATGVSALQVNTGKGCHLDAHMIGHALGVLEPEAGAVLFIENVGNLVCPAGFDLGEAHKVVILSVTEGEDKPIKYPDMFAAADVLLLNKIDLLPYLDFDVTACIEYARRVNPEIRIYQLSARSGEGMQSWVDWIRDTRRRVLAGVPEHG